MSEQIEQPAQQDESPQYSLIEEQALAQGWVPKDQYTGDEESFIDAKEFVRRGELFAKIDTQSRKLKNMEKALGALKEHYTTVEKAAYERALKDLKASEKQALVDGDVEKYYQIQDEIKDAETQAAKIAEVSQALNVPDEAPVVAPEFQAWKSRNGWYDSFKYMREYADEVGQQLYQQGLDKHTILKRVEDAVRKEFPNKFVNPNRDKPGMTEQGRSSGRSSKGDDFQLTDQEKRIMETLIKSDPKTFTKEKYIADLKLAKGVK